ncbi:MAG: phosphoribosylanthranilate isomerase [Oscillospiraceae bacterium]|nr:phosphoribosylanthranilate isomerase [Oscillospiraceae bacterium]
MIKLCGMRREEDISFANEAMPDFIGMILAEGYRRTMDFDTAARITKALDPSIKKVGVFLNTDVEKICSAAEKISLDIIQLHGDETEADVKKLRRLGLPIWKAFTVHTAEDVHRAEEFDCDVMLLECFSAGEIGGSGKVFNGRLLEDMKISRPFFLAGGINLGNIREALEISPNIDISGGVETDGVKDRQKILDIMKIYNERKQRYE